MAATIEVNDDLVVFYGDNKSMTYDAKVNLTELISFYMKCFIIS